MTRKFLTRYPTDAKTRLAPDKKTVTSQSSIAHRDEHFNLSVSRAQQEFDTEHSTKNSGTSNCRCRCQYGICERLEREQDDAVVEYDEFKDDEFNASNKGNKYA